MFHDQHETSQCVATGAAFFYTQLALFCPRRWALAPGRARTASCRGFPLGVSLGVPSLQPYGPTADLPPPQSLLSLTFDQSTHNTVPS